MLEIKPHIIRQDIRHDNVLMIVLFVKQKIILLMINHVKTIRREKTKKMDELTDMATSEVAVRRPTTYTYASNQKTHESYLPKSKSHTKKSKFRQTIILDNKNKDKLVHHHTLSS